MKILLYQKNYHFYPMTPGVKIQKRKIWLIAAAIVLPLAFLIFLWIYIPSFLSEKLKAYTEEKSDGLYSLSVGGIRPGIFPFSVTFNEVSLEPRDGDYINPAGHTFNYSFSAEKVEVRDIALGRLLNERIFTCRDVNIVRPSIKLEGEELLQIDSLQISDSFATNMWPLFGFVDEVSVRKIQFREAHFGFYAAAGDSNFISRAEKVSVDILGFYTSSAMAAAGNSMFSTDDVLIRMNHFSINMGDSLHVSRIDTLLYSLKTTDIRVKNFRLSPISLDTEKNLFEVKVPEVYIKSQSIAHFALSDSIKIGFLEFLRPDIRFYQKKEPGQLHIEDLNEFDLYSLVQNQFVKVEVDTFFLHDAHMEIFRQPEINNYRQQFNMIDVTLHGFALDASSSVNPAKMFHSDGMEMQVAGYHLKLEDTEHHFKAESVYVSTFTNQLSAKNISINPSDGGKINARTLMNIECRVVNIEDLEFLRLYHGRVLPASKIELVEPNVNLMYRLDRKKKEKEQASGLLYDIITGYMKGVYADNVTIDNGSLDIRNSEKEVLKGYFESNFDFHLTGFRLDSSSVERSSNFFFASDFDLEFSDYSMRLIDDFHKLDVGKVTVSSRSNNVQVDNLELQPVNENITVAQMRNLNHNELYRVSIPSVRLRNIDLNRAFFHKQLHISQFDINEPRIYFENIHEEKTADEKARNSEIYSLLFNYIEDFDIRKFSINGGRLTWINHTRQGETTSFDNEFSASLENFRLNQNELEKQRLLFSDQFELSVKDQEFELSDNVHVLKGGEIILSSSRSMIKVKKALLFPLITSDNYTNLPATWQVAIPEINIEGFDFHKAYYSQEPEIGLLEIMKPKLQVYLKSDKAKWLDSNTYQFPMPSFVESLKVKEFKITQAQAISYKVDGLQHNAMANFFFDLRMPDLLLKSNELNQIDISQGNVWFQVSDFRSPIDDYHNLAIEGVEFDRNRKSIVFTGLDIKPFKPAPHRNTFTIKGPKISFSGFDFDSAINDGEFQFSHIEAASPDIFISVGNDMKDDTLDFRQDLDLYPYVEHLVNQIRVGRLDITNVDFQLTRQQKIFSHNQINLSFNHIMIGENMPPKGLLNASEFMVSTGGLSSRSKDNLYEYSIDSLIYKSTSQSVFLKNIDVRPLIPRERFPLQDGYQRDVARLNIDYARLTGMNERRWLREQVLDAALLEIGPLNADIYRNKRFPFKHNRKPLWPQDLIRELDQKFVFDSVKLMPSNIRYSELTPISDEPGFIEFNRLILTGGRLTNIENIRRQSDPFRLNAKAQLYGQGLLSVQFSFNLADENNTHTAKGFMEHMNLSPLNHILTKSEPIAVENGKLQRLEFDLTFNNKASVGEMYAGYNDLKIAVLNFSGPEVQKDRFTSFLANTLKVNSNSSGQSKVLIAHQRDEERSIIHFWWKSLFSGIKSIIGA